MLQSLHELPVHEWRGGDDYDAVGKGCVQLTYVL